MLGLLSARCWGRCQRRKRGSQGVAVCSWGVRKRTQVGTIRVLKSAEALVLEAGDQPLFREERSVGGPLSSGLDGRSF